MGMIMRNGVPYAQGSEIPQGGTKGQVLAKASDLDGDMQWKDEEGGGGGGGDAYTKAETDALLDAKQDTLESGTNIKTVAGESILGSGDIPIPTYVGSGWGVAKQGAVSVSSGSPATVSLADTSITSAGDYQVATQPQSSRGSDSWVRKEATSFEIRTSETNSVTIYYAVLAKGYGGVPNGGTTGQVLAKKSNADGDTEWVTGGGTGETPTLDAVLKKGNQTDSSARFTDELNGVQAEIYAGGTYMTGNGTEGMRQFSVSQNGIRAVDNLVGTITPKFVVPFEPSGEDQVSMSDAVKESFKKALGIANDSFVFDVDSDQFTQDPDNPDGKHYGVTITSPTYDELLAMLQADTLVYARMMYNSGNAYEIIQLFHNNNSIYGRYFDVEFPQKRLQFASAYVNKRNNNTYFGTYQDYIGGSGDSVVTLYDVNNMPTAPTVMSDVQNNRLCYIDGHWLVTGYDKNQVSSGKFIIYADYNDERVTYVFAIQGENLTSVISRTVAKKPEFGISIEVGVERWQGTYTDETGTVYQVYSKMIYIPALPSTAGITAYDHGISGIKQILQVYGFTADGFVLNAPRQNAQDNIAIYQMSKSASNKTLSIEVGKDRSSKSAYVVMVYAKNN